MSITTYTEATGADRDVAAFVAAHATAINLYKLPAKIWVARYADQIVAVLLLNTTPYLALDLVVADITSRPFMRIFRLWKMAEAWLRTNQVPIVCTSIHNSLVHYQSLVRRLGFEKIGDECAGGEMPIETIYAKTLREPVLSL